MAVYYFPQYHPDRRNDRWHGDGWTEWELVKAARPRFPGHRQPVVPGWGYFDESDPCWAAREIDLAADHGITCFIYDWYWYEDGPFLQDGLEKGFLNAPNNQRLNFALMWANHDWINVHPAKLAHAPEVLMYAGVSRKAFDEFTDYVVETYFRQPNYWRVNGEPYFSIYELETFVAGIGGMDQARDALDGFRAKTRAAGFDGLHLNAIVRGVSLLPVESDLPEPELMVESLGFSSVGTYTWVHHSSPNADGFPIGSYETAAARNYGAWDEFSALFRTPYYPNVTMGWDSSPRTIQTDVYTQAGYPWTAMLQGNTPEAFRDALSRAKAFVVSPESRQRIVTINAWNEWTEGSYLLPDTVHGNAYLEAIREVFGQGSRSLSEGRSHL